MKRRCLVCREERQLLGEDEHICPDCHQRLSAIAATLRRFSHHERDGELPAAGPTAAGPTAEQKTKQQSRVGTAPITMHFPEEVRRQLKILAAEEGRSFESMVEEAFNLLLAKYGKAEIAPVKGLEPPAGLPEPRGRRTGRNLPTDAKGVSFGELLEKVRDALAREQEARAEDGA